MDEPNQNTPAALTTTPVDADFLDKRLNHRLSQQMALAFSSSGAVLIAFTVLALQQRLASVSSRAGPHTCYGPSYHYTFGQIVSVEISA